MPSPLRVVFLTRDSLYTRDFLSTFLEEEGAGWRLAGIGLSTAAFRRGRPRGSDTLALIRTVGLRHALYLGWVAEVAPRILRTGPAPARVARRRGIDLHRTNDVNGPASVAWLRGIAPDLLVTAHFNQRIAPHVLALPRLGGVNVHPSLLPAYAGVDPVTMALRHGATTLGVTVHLLAPELDAGDILLQEGVPARSGGVVANSRPLFRRGGTLARRVLRDVHGALEERRPQSREDRCYHGWDAVGQRVR